MQKKTPDFILRPWLTENPNVYFILFYFILALDQRSFVVLLIRDKFPPL